MEILRNANDYLMIQRRSEFREACEKLKASNLGDKTKSMICIQLLCTAPEKQRRGYGSALVNTIAAMVGILLFHFKGIPLCYC